MINKVEHIKKQDSKTSVSVLADIWCVNWYNRQWIGFERDKKLKLKQDIFKNIREIENKIQSDHDEMYNRN